eukprot:10935511-Karenia_brevis.AAC.1
MGFSAAISSCEKGGQWQRVAPLLAEMQSRGLSPIVISIRAAIQLAMMVDSSFMRCQGSTRCAALESNDNH